ncbi:tripartite tricarboxylate transporter TctB family protein [Bacillus sp. USDA818B3_A]|uniref:tripartite tricarboxylate transporter TctB family protein n=1 Tax=Bacillus sp. USDA818B3_A TaxID=2698834 RepID=UPI00136A79D1|nr:tripartite tricarboxylate transporter TctB family protein [Bacillus sp. USDA818B3_A]
MRIKLISPDGIGGVIAIILGFLSIYESIRLYPYSQKLLTGDHTFPGLLGILLVIAGLFLVIKQKRKEDNESILPKGRTGFIMLASIVILFIYCFLIEFIGYFFSTLLAFVFLIKLIGNYRWVFSGVMAAVLTTLLYLLFIVLLKTPFPSINLPF